MAFDPVGLRDGTLSGGRTHFVDDAGVDEKTPSVTLETQLDEDLLLRQIRKLVATGDLGGPVGKTGLETGLEFAWVRVYPARRGTRTASER